MTQSDIIHLQLLSTCLLCQQDVDVGESTALIFGNPVTSKYWGCISKFDFPRWSPHPEDIVIPTVVGLGSGVLCRSVRCNLCCTGPETFVFHITCFKFLKGMQKDLTPKQIWHVGTWLRPLPKKYGNLVAPSSLHTPASLHKLVSIVHDLPSTFNKATEFHSLFKHFGLLPSELQSIVYSYSRNTFLWRFAFVLDFENILLKLGNENTMVRSLPLRKWIRGMSFEASSDELSAKDFVRLGLDNRGIKTCQVLEDVSIPEIAVCSWYIVKGTSSFQKLVLESSGGLLRFRASFFVDRPLRYWDCPNPPDPEACHFIGDVTYSNHLRCINLSAIFGLTIFTANGLTYAIHAHTDKSSSAIETYRRIPARLAKHLVWMFFPLCPNENISAVWVRHRPEESNKLSSPILVLRTTSQRERVLGEYIKPERSEFFTEPIGKGIPIQLIYNDPEPGEPIMLFGATYNVMAKLHSITTPSFHHPLAPPSIHLSHASLEEVIAVSMFIEEETENCLGLLLKYQNGFQECLGQCRIGFDKKITVTSPTALHICHFDHGEMNYSVRVKVSTKTSSAEIDEPDWKTFQMKDHIIWWFNSDSNLVSIETYSHH